MVILVNKFDIFSAADLTSLSFFQLDIDGYPTAEIIPIRTKTTNSSNNVKPLIS